MRKRILALRAIGAELVYRLWWPQLIGFIIISCGLIGGTIWLSYAIHHLWIWLLLPVIILLSVGAAILTIIMLLARYLSPVTTADQRKATKQYVSQLQKVSNIARTPKYILLFRIVKDIAAPSEATFLSDATVSTKTLKTNFDRLTQFF